MDNSDFQPLEKYLRTVISPKHLANYLDELIYDYLKMLTRLRTLNEEDSIYFYDEIETYIFHVKQLRDALLKCQ